MTLELNEGAASGGTRTPSNACQISSSTDSYTRHPLSLQGIVGRYHADARNLTGAAKWAALSLARHFAAAPFEESAR